MGQVLSGGDSRTITAEELRAIGEMRQAMTQIPVPTLRHADNLHEYLFFAFMDGSGQDVNNPKLGLPTNVGLLYRQAEKLESDPNNRIGAGYSEGIGSQSNIVARWYNGALARDWDEGIEKIYLEFAKQSKKWIDADPQAQIRVAGLSYSRGSVQEAGFHRLVEQYGIANWKDIKFGRDEHGNITVESSLPPLVPPGQVAQATLLLDPVATNMPRNYDARLPGSVISRVSVLATTEQRELYPHQAIVDPGMSDGGLSLNVSVPGGHSNLGGGNQEPGVEILVGNAAVNYLNLLSDKPLFEKRPVPHDLSAFTIYQAQGVTAAWGLKMDDDGRRNLRDELANCKIVDPCRDSEPVNQELAAKFEYRHIQLDPLEQAQLQGLIAQATAREQTLPQTPSPDRAQIATLQSGLIQLGYHRAISQPLHVNGVNDAATREAVTAFQARNDLPMTSTFDAATQQALQQSLLAQQQATEQRQTEDKTREQELAEKEQKTKEQARSEELLPYSDPNSPHHTHRADLAQRSQAAGVNLTEEQLTLGVAQMQAHHIKPGWEGGVTVHDGILYIRQYMPPEHFRLDTRQPAPPVQETLQQAVIQQREHAEEMARMEAMPKIHGPSLGPGSPGGMPSVQG